MERRIGRLQPAAEAARSKENEAARQLAESERYRAESANQLQQLNAFRMEYAGQLQRASQSSVTAQQVQHYITFLANLDRSIAEAERKLVALRTDYQSKRNDWIKHRSKTKALDIIIERYCREQKWHEEKQLQREEDERTSQRRWNIQQS